MTVSPLWTAVSSHLLTACSGWLSRSLFLCIYKAQRWEDVLSGKAMPSTWLRSCLANEERDENTGMWRGKKGLHPRVIGWEGILDISKDFFQKVRLGEEYKGLKMSPCYLPNKSHPFPSRYFRCLLWVGSCYTHDRYRYSKELVRVMLYKGQRELLAKNGESQAPVIKDSTLLWLAAPSAKNKRIHCY